MSVGAMSVPDSSDVLLVVIAERSLVQVPHELEFEANVRGENRDYRGVVRYVICENAIEGAAEILQPFPVASSTRLARAVGASLDVLATM
jgi:hypothetical protein